MPATQASNGIAHTSGDSLALEAIEGTDQAIRRGGSLGNGNVVVVKVAKPAQDLRFDVPAIGNEHGKLAAGLDVVSADPAQRLPQQAWSEVAAAGGD